MVFPTISTYVDPANWQQQLSYGSTVSTGLIPPPPPPLPLPPPPPHGVGGAGSVRPGSMAERARMANVPMAETALKCPRCESRNTKFCYFNNYSLSQPRHFCKTCRRYWTRGGALRSVPVGGGCRRNKRSSKAAAATSTTTATSKSSANSETAAAAAAAANSNSTTYTNSDISQPRYMPPLSHYAEMGMLNYGSPAGTTTSEMNHHVPIDSNLFGGGDLLLSSGVEAWRMMQQGQGQQHYVPPNFLGGFDPTTAQGGGGMFNYPNYYGGSGGGNSNNYAGAKMLNSSVLSQALVKMEMNNNNNNNNNNHGCETNLGMGSVGGGSEHQMWDRTNATAAAWKNVSGFNSSSTSNH